jgi:2-hydroxychromene-2-carboxylate isomerase
VSDAAFYFDLRSPLAYLAAERALSVLEAPCEWQPILTRLLPTSETFEAYRCEQDLLAAKESIERRGAALGLQPIRWPAPFPFDSDFAMLVATFARRIGKTVPFALAAFRQAFAGGRALSESDNVLLAAAACEIHPASILKAAGLESVRRELEQTTADALAAGVTDVPAVRIGDRVLIGERSLERAGALRGASG